MVRLQNNAGFSLIELAVIIGIAGLLTATFSQQYKTWLNDKISGDTESRMNLVSSAMTLFLTNYGRLPCPADPALPPDAANAGYEICLVNFGQNPPDYAVTNGEVRRVPGRRDAPATLPAPSVASPDGDGLTDPVLTGAVPYAALGLAAKDVVDGWGNKLTYAVTEYLTRTATFHEQFGAIRFMESSFVLADTDGDMTDADEDTGEWEKVGVNPPITSANPEVVDPGPDPDAPLIDSFMLAIVSHGQDGKGAFSYQGRRNSLCPDYDPLAPAPGTSYDNENCDGDAIFIKASRSTGIQNNVPGPTFFDDAFTLFTIRRDSDKWAVTGSNGMQNKSGGRVGIGTQNPTAELDVGGNILLQDFWANSYCSSTSVPKNCFAPTLIGGAINDTDPGTSAAHCGTLGEPKLMRGLDGDALWKTVCVDTLDMTGITASSCPANYYMKGFDATGAIICEPPP